MLNKKSIHPFILFNHILTLQNEILTYLSMRLTLLIAILVFLLFYVDVPVGSREVLFMLLGVVVKEWGSAMQFWFGTTRSSSDKTRLMIK